VRRAWNLEHPTCSGSVGHEALELGRNDAVLFADHEPRRQLAPQGPRERADDAASSIADALPSRESESSAGDSDPLLAAEDLLRDFSAHEVVVVTRPNEEATWLEEDDSEVIARRLRSLKVTRLVVSDSD
jgi:hypothetical protein